MKNNSNCQGASKWISILLIALFVLVAVQLAKPYYRYYNFLVYAKNTMKIQSSNSGTISSELISYAKIKNIPLREENLSVDIENMRVSVYAKWSDMIDVYGYYQKRVEFVIDEKY